MGVRTPKIFSTVNNHQDAKMEKLLHLVVDIFECRYTISDIYLKTPWP
jgi:hypothetical protein